MQETMNDWRGEHLIRCVPRGVKDIASQAIANIESGERRDIITIDAIKRLAEKGLSISKIAVELKVSLPYICTVAKREGIIVPDGRKQRRRK